ncbi:MAG TPA: hypothetical protein VK808_05275 [Bacteroidia bacterium]|jgi:hypothetical protein|nr:hypothetical protein [Bacteroidia bacterium]
MALTNSEKCKRYYESHKDKFRKYQRIKRAKIRDKIPVSIRSAKNNTFGTDGLEGEKIALSILPESVHIHRPCDLFWKGKFIDVKTSKKMSTTMIDYKTGKSIALKTFRWKFILSRQKGKVDFFLLICKNQDNKVEHIFLIPDKDLPNNLSIAESNIPKFEKYRLIPTIDPHLI